jgi:hypothetical protein
MADSITADLARMALPDEVPDEDDFEYEDDQDDEFDSANDDDGEDGAEGEKPKSKKKIGPPRKMKPKKPLPPDVTPVERGFLRSKFMSEAFRIVSKDERLPDVMEDGELKRQGLYIEEARFNKLSRPQYTKGMTLEEKQEARYVYDKYWEGIDPLILEAAHDYNFVLRFRSALIDTETLEQRNKMRKALELNDVGDPTGVFSLSNIRELTMSKTPHLFNKVEEKNEKKKAQFFLFHLKKVPEDKRAEFAAKHGRDMTTGSKLDVSEA